MVALEYLKARAALRDLTLVSNDDSLGEIRADMFEDTPHRTDYSRSFLTDDGRLPSRVFGVDTYI